MFCPKCHTELEDDTFICPRCNTKIQSNKFSFGSFSSSKTFERMNTKNIMNESHQKQYDYSKEYSDILNEINDSHEEQYTYSKKYSNVKKENTNTHEEQYSYSKNYSEPVLDTTITEEDYILAFQGYQSMENIMLDSTISIGTMIFGPFYLLYRKIWPKAIILIIIYMLLGAFAQEEVNILCKIIINIILALNFKKIYHNYAEKKVKEIKQMNPDKTSRELLKECCDVGGTLSYQQIILNIVIYILLMIGFHANYTSTPKPIENETESLEQISYKLPPNTTHYSNTDTYKSYGYGYCHISISVNKYTRYQSEQEYLLTVNKDIHNKTDIQKDVYLNKTWFHQQIQEENNEIYNVYVTKHYNVMYDITFYEREPNACDIPSKIILNSAKFE